VGAGGVVAWGGLGFGGGDEADVHIEIAVFVEAREAERNPVLAATGFDPIGFEEHVEDQGKVAGVQGVFPWPDYANKAPACDDEAVEEAVTAVL